MNQLRNLSIRTKLILLSGAAVCFALLVSSSGIILNDVRMIRSMTRDQLEVQARMIAFNSDGVLAFLDVQAANDYLQSMSLQPSVEVACLLDTQNDIFAFYSKQDVGKPQIPKDLIEGTRLTSDDHIEIVMRVKEDNSDGEFVGTLFIRANTDEASAHMATQFWHVGIVAFLSLLGSVGVTVMLQGAISKPILRLTEAAQDIMRSKDYSIRVQRAAKDELGTLYYSFNKMLDALKRSHDQVSDQADLLTKEVTDRIHAQEESMIAKEAAEESDRAKSNFLANMSHEIRTPLTGILGFADLLLSGGDDEDVANRVEYLTTIKTSGVHLLSVINDILDLSKIESGQIEFDCEACHPHLIVAEVVRVLHLKATGEDLTLTARWENHIPDTIQSDASRLRQLLINLVGNAIKFTACGSVEIVGKLIQWEGRTQLQIDVIDTGIGIEPKKLDKIFQPFVQADSSVTRRFGGTGLGLAISRQIARGLGGDLTADSEPGVGSKFTVRFDTGNIEGVPLVSRAEAYEAKLDPADLQQQPTEIPPTDILLVEDGDTNRKLICLLLERAGATVATAENGKIGVALALSHEFDIILMDMQMPVLDGYSAARQLRDAGKTLPIIALTAHAMRGDREKCLASGCTDYLTKPIDANQLIAAVLRGLSNSKTVKNQHKESRHLERFGGQSKTSPELKGSHHDMASTLPTDDPEFAEIVVEFIDRLGTKLDEIDAAWNRGQLEELASLAHWLKGSGGTAGFEHCTKPAVRLELLAKTEQAVDIPAAIEHIRTLHSRMVAPHNRLPST